MVDGSLEYFKNGTSWGIAFKDPELAKGELVAAISPIYVNDVVTLRSLIKEDWTKGNDYSIDPLIYPNIYIFVSMA